MNEVGNPKELEGIPGYMKIGAILDSEGVVWVVARGAHLEAAITMVAARLGVGREQAIEAILSERVIDLGKKGYFNVGPKTFEATENYPETSMGATLKRSRALCNG